MFRKRLRSVCVCLPLPTEQEKQLCIRDTTDMYFVTVTLFIWNAVRYRDDAVLCRKCVKCRCGFSVKESRQSFSKSSRIPCKRNGWTLLHGAFLEDNNLARTKARETWRRVLRKRKASAEQAVADRKRGPRRMSIPLACPNDQSGV